MGSLSTRDKSEGKGIKTPPFVRRNDSCFRSERREMVDPPNVDEAEERAAEDELRGKKTFPYVVSRLRCRRDPDGEEPAESKPFL